MPRQEWVNGKFVKHTDDDQEAWVDLFLDLIFVVLLSSLGGFYDSCDWSRENTIRTAIHFVSICLTRQGLVEYSNRFYSHDLVQKVTYLVYTFGVVVQVFALNISLVAHEHECSYLSQQTIGVVTGIVITRISLIIMYGLVILHHPKAWAQFRYDLLRWAITCLLMALIVILHIYGTRGKTVDGLLLIIYLVNEILIWVVSRVWFRHHFHFPVNLEALQSRWGVWVMIVIGESIIQLLNQTMDFHFLMDKLLYILLAVTLLFSLAMQYFDSCHVEWFDHALTKSAVAGVSWIWLHLLLTFLLFLLGIFFRFQLESMNTNHFQSLLRLPGLLALISVVLTIMRICHTSLYSLSMLLKISYTCRGLLSLIQLMLRFATFKTQTTMLATQLVICVMFNVIDIVVDLYTVQIEKELISNGSFKPPVLPKQWANLQIYVTDKHTILTMGDDDVVAATSGKFQTRRRNQEGTDLDNGTITGTTDVEVDLATNNTNVVRNRITLNLADLFENAHQPHEVARQDSRPHFFGDLHWQPIPSPSQGQQSQGHQYSRSKIFVDNHHGGDSVSGSPALSRGVSMWDNVRSDKGVVLFKRVSNKPYMTSEARLDNEGLDGGNSSRKDSNHSNSTSGGRLHKYFFERIVEDEQPIEFERKPRLPTRRTEDDYEYQDLTEGAAVVHNSDGVLTLTDFKKGHLVVLENIQSHNDSEHGVTST